MGYYPYDTIENVAIAAFDDGAPVPVKQLELAITPVQTGTGDPAPDNVRPIIGFTKAEIAVAAENLMSAFKDGATFGSATIKNIGGKIFINGTAGGRVNSESTYLKKGAYIFEVFKETGTSTGTLQIDVRPVDGDPYLEPVYVRADTPTGKQKATINITADGFYRFSLYASSATFKNLALGLQVGLVETDDFKPYTGEITSINFPAAAGTVYSGTLKYTGGGKYLLTTDKAAVDLGDLTFSAATIGGFLSFRADGVNAPEGQKAGGAFICSAYKNVGSFNEWSRITQQGDCVVGGLNSAVGIVIRDDTYDNVEDFTAAVNGVILVYELATPQTYEITAEVVETLYKNNVIFANTGNIIKLEYRLNQLDYYRRLEMYNFGYIMMDGGGIDLSSSDPQTITGAWARTVEAIKTGKPIFAYNTKYGTGKNLTPVPCFAWYINSTTAVIVGATLHIQVTSDDTCVVQDVAPSVNRALTMGIDELAEKAVDDGELKTNKAKTKK